MTKSCRKCGEGKDCSEFRERPRYRDGLDSWCAACHVEATRQWRSRKREVEREALWAPPQATYERQRPDYAAWRARVAELQAERTAQLRKRLESQRALPALQRAERGGGTAGDRLPPPGPLTHARQTSAEPR